MDQRACFLLVNRIHKREQIADGDRLDAGGLELAHYAANGVPVELPQDASGVIAALGNLLGQALGRDSWRLGIEIIEQVAVARLVLNLLHGAITLGDEKRDRRAAHLQQRVRGDGGAVGEKTDLRRRDTLGDESGDAFEHAQRGVFRCARHLLDRKLACRRIEQNEIGVGATHVDAEPVTRGIHAGLPENACRTSPRSE